MKDGQKIPPGMEPLDHLTLTSAGWWPFEVPLELGDDVFPWMYDTLGVSLDTWEDNDFVYAERRLIEAFVISIRREADAILFKLSWPECASLWIEQKQVLFENFPDGG